MSSGSTPCGIGRPEAGPLIDALRDDSPATRLAVLDALTRLPARARLSGSRCASTSMWALEDSTAPEHLDVIETATPAPESAGASTWTTFAARDLSAAEREHV